jgi:S1-C subfamily serine protease
MADGHLTSAPNPATQYAPTLAAIIFIMKRLLLILMGIITTSTISYSQILEIIDGHILNGTYQQIEGKWRGSAKVTVYLEKQLIGKNTLPQEMTYLFFNDNGTIRGSTSPSLSDAVLELTGGSNGSYIAYMPFKGYEYVRGAAKSTGNTLSVILEYKKVIEYGVVQNSFVEWELRKQYPVGNDFEVIKSKEIERRKNEIENLPRTGTGFALSTNGLIVTNYHVIEKAKSIDVRGINGDFTKSFTAEIIKADETADLAIIKIDDPLFSNLGKVPFLIYSDNIDVGEDVFSLGYPLTQTMGEEIKLTTGIISANSGFQGNRNQYQISVPLQPGNSGGPLFDKIGRIVGIVNARHTNTDNVSYAIKARNLLGYFI